MEKLIRFSLKNKLIVILFTCTVIAAGLYSLSQIPIGAVPDITNNQVQVITTSRDLSTQDMEKFVTFPLELEMTNLPGVKEVRSISKFGLSVVTIVFEDDMGTYLPRQLIAEKLKIASANIPEGFGRPFMGPISTGLGEIYQYILDVKPGYEGKYSPMDLRTIQDWIVKRQLAGIPGVVEVNTWGGYLKQYEVAINPNKLRAMNISIGAVFSALEKNNSVTGGGYIEKANESYFIRAEGLINSIPDIERIIVSRRDGVPVYLRDIATVTFGSATRFGAITGNGQGEKVLGQVMMLKGANSKQVIENVKQRVEEVQRTLPEGVYINPFLERSQLIEKTTFTIMENLLIGCLIVVFVVILLLGNIRSGLVVASVIPLSLLFALTMMYIFGVDANLMSLGAIDFGIIIDGAVIIVEFVAFQISSRSRELAGLSITEKKNAIDKITFDSTSKMMRSAIFGQLIILIVFIPILSLTNVEGKMFKPMALTFCFALIGAMIFCFTFVPVISSIFLKPVAQNRHTISHKLLSFLNKIYSPTIELALRYRRIVIFAALTILLLTFFTFSKMGGEFVPTLDEGDFVIQPVLKTGTSLSKTIDLTSEMEKILRGFPEVKQVVSRIGAAEVPTDPMSMEESDVIITLKPLDEWQTASSKDELADKFKEALSIIPGVDYEFTQPIEMRFNELITGVRADLAIKVFGEDLDILYRKGLEIEALIKDVPGASDITVEKITGLPQIRIQYNRAQIARYGLNILDLNRVIAMSFAGTAAGSVFEGEKQFDLVVRYEEAFRNDINNIRQTYVPLPDGGQVSLDQLADIAIQKGPAKISRDNARRRIVVGVNVRNRDLESVVSDVQALISANIKLPAGYSINYGGQFENLRTARQRLMIAVPIALLLILILLHFAFRSFSEALMVYSAIPLAAVGGVFLLWIRSMPFSISAGVGFIALFGIAVLNGIVLIEHFKELKEDGVSDIKERVLTGTRQRLRPVLLTASAAALGFLPMAISTSAGAEVQRPLATVVIGGLISATLLTLIVLPVIYYILEQRNDRKNSAWKAAPLSLLFIMLFLPGQSYGQAMPLTLPEAIEIAGKNNNAALASALVIKQQQQLSGTAFNPGKTTLYYNEDETNLTPSDEKLKVWGVHQEIPFPTTFFLRKQFHRSQAETATHEHAQMVRRISREVTAAYETIVYLQNTLLIYTELDSIYQNFADAASYKYELGESNYLEKVTADAQQKEIELQLLRSKADIRSAYWGLSELLQNDIEYVIPDNQLFMMSRTAPPTTDRHPGLLAKQAATNSAKIAARLERSRLLPDIQLDFFRSTTDNGQDSYTGFQVGLRIPIWFFPNKAHIATAVSRHRELTHRARDYQIRLTARQNKLINELANYEAALKNYRGNGQLIASQLYQTARESFRTGEIDFFQYLLSMKQSKSMEINYLTDLHRYNQIVIELNYLTD